VTYCSKASRGKKFCPINVITEPDSTQTPIRRKRKGFMSPQVKGLEHEAELFFLFNICGSEHHAL